MPLTPAEERELAELERMEQAELARAEHQRMATKSGAAQQAAYDSAQPSALGSVGAFAGGIYDSISPSPVSAAKGMIEAGPTQLTAPLKPPSAPLVGAVGKPAATALSAVGDVVGRGMRMAQVPLSMMAGPAVGIPELVRSTGVIDAAAEADPLAFGVGQIGGTALDLAIGGKGVGKGLGRAGTSAPSSGGIIPKLQLAAAKASPEDLAKAAGMLPGAIGKPLAGALRLKAKVDDAAPQGDYAAMLKDQMAEPLGGAPALQPKPPAPTPGAPALQKKPPVAGPADSLPPETMVREAEGFDPRGEGWNNWNNQTPATPKPGITPPSTSISTPLPPPPGATRVDRTPAPTPSIPGAPALMPKAPAELPPTSVMDARTQNQLAANTDPRFAPDSTGVQAKVAAVEAQAKANAAALQPPPLQPAQPPMSLQQMPLTNIPKATESGLYKSGPSKVDAMSTADKRAHAKQLLAQGMSSADVAKALKMTPRQVKLLTAGK